MPVFRVIIAEDNAPLRIGLERILERDGLEVVGTNKNGQEVVDMTLALKPYVVVLNIQMPSMDGLTAPNAIHSAKPATKVLMYTGFSTQVHLMEAFANGASGYLVKDRSPINIPDAVRAVAMGEMIVDLTLLQEILATIRDKRPTESSDDPKDASDLKRMLRDNRKSKKPDDSSSP